jgi:TPP-dependent 2-oxoacid decarboxylase
MNNDGYTTERTIVDGTFNDLQPWKYSLLPVVFGGRQGCDVRTEGELEVALKGVKFGENTPHFIEFHLDKWDCSPVLRNVGTAMRRHNSIPF